MGSTQQTFNNADELCWTAASSGACASPPTGATTYTYDTRGNRTRVTPATGGATTLAYDQANRLTSYGANAAYMYNGDGLRMSKTISGTTSQFLWDVAPALPLLLKDGLTAYLYGPGGLPFEQINASTAIWLHQDQLGSTRLVTDSGGAAQATYTYDAYGNLTASSGTISNPMQFSGEYRDAESGSYYLRARYYDPSTGQFISRDADLVITGRPYSYVSNDPLNYRDPYGLDGRVGENGEPVNAWDIIKQFRSLTPEEEQNYRQYLRSLGLEPEEGAGPKLPSEKIEMQRLRAEETPRLRENGTNPAQDKRCTFRELVRAGFDPHELKDGAKGVDIYKDAEGNLYLKPLNGSGPGDPLEIKIR
jgi:RHS repeat-associated protein